jgi:hypothetical protein
MVERALKAQGSFAAGSNIITVNLPLSLVKSLPGFFLALSGQ